MLTLLPSLEGGSLNDNADVEDHAFGGHWWRVGDERSKFLECHGFNWKSLSKTNSLAHLRPSVSAIGAPRIAPTAVVQGGSAMQSGSYLRAQTDRDTPVPTDNSATMAPSRQTGSSQVLASPAVPHWPNRTKKLSASKQVLSSLDQFEEFEITDSSIRTMPLLFVQKRRQSVGKGSVRQRHSSPCDPDHPVIAQR